MSELFENTTPKKLHALWHTFAPSDRLKESIGIITGSDVGPNFLLQSTKEVYVDSIAYAQSDLHAQEIEAKEAIQKAKDVHFVIEDMRINALFKNGTKASKQPDFFRFEYKISEYQQREFDKLENTLSVFPEAIAREGLSKHFLYFKVPARNLLNRDMDYVKESYQYCQEDIRDPRHQRLYSAAIVGLQGIDR